MHDIIANLVTFNCGPILFSILVLSIVFPAVILFFFSFPLYKDRKSHIYIGHSAYVYICILVMTHIWPYINLLELQKFNNPVILLINLQNISYNFGKLKDCKTVRFSNIFSMLSVSMKCSSLESK